MQNNHAEKVLTQQSITRNQNSFPSPLQQTQQFDLSLQQNQEIIDWYKIQSIDLKSIKQNNDVDTLDAIIPSIINSNITQEEFENVKPKNIQKIVEILQMSLYYFDFTNDYLENLEIETQNEIQNQEYLIQQNEKFLKKSKVNINKMKEDVEIKQEIIKKYEKFLKKNPQYKCHICVSKYFDNPDYLTQHMYKRHAQQMLVSAQHPDFMNFQNLIQNTYLEKEIMNQKFKNFEQISDNQKLKEKQILEKIISQNQEENQLMLQNIEIKMQQLEKLYNAQQLNKQNGFQNLPNQILKDEINQMHQQLRNIMQNLPKLNQVQYNFQGQQQNNLIQKIEKVQQQVQKPPSQIQQDKQYIEIEIQEKKQSTGQDTPTSIQTPIKQEQQSITQSQKEIEEMEQYSNNNQSSQVPKEEFDENYANQYLIDQRPEQLMEEEKEFISLISNKYKHQFNQEDKQNVVKKIDNQIYNELYSLGLNIGDLNSLSESELQQMVSKLKNNKNQYDVEQYNPYSKKQMNPAQSQNINRNNLDSQMQRNLGETVFSQGSSLSNYNKILSQFGDSNKINKDQQDLYTSSNNQHKQKLRVFKHEDTISKKYLKNSDIYDSKSGFQIPSGLIKQFKQPTDEDFND